MSGILEQMQQRIDALENAMRQMMQGGQQANTAQTLIGSAGGLMAGGLNMGGQQAQQPNVTDQMIVDLASKLVANEGAKQAALGLLASMGIPSLPDTRPDQYPALYQGLQQIERQFFGGGQQGNALGGLGGFGGQQGGANPGII